MARRRGTRRLSFGTCTCLLFATGCSRDSPKLVITSSGAEDGFGLEERTSSLRALVKIRHQGEQSGQAVFHPKKLVTLNISGSEPKPLLDIRSFGDPVTNRCSDMNLSIFDEGRKCGVPLSSPCFNHSRCHAPPGSSGPKIYIYDEGCSLGSSHTLPMEVEGSEARKMEAMLRIVADKLGVLAETYESACMFLFLNDRTKHVCAASSPLWNHGVNHVGVCFPDQSRDYWPEVAQSYAMEASSNMRTCYYRSGYDISIPMGPKHEFKEMATIPPDGRKFFLTFKGTLYLQGHGSEERMSVLPLNDEANGVIVAMHCFEKHDHQLIPKNVEPCKALSELYEKFDYRDMMNTTFGLVPAGRSPGSYRLAEVMSTGAIPVFVARDIVRPFREQIDWPSFSFVFAPDQVETDMMDTLRAVPPERLVEMQRKTLEAYHTMFGDDGGFETVAHLIISLLRDRVRHQ